MSRAFFCLADAWRRHWPEAGCLP